MTRLPASLTALLLALLVIAGCADDEPDQPTKEKSPAMDARSMKDQVDDAVLALGPGLVKDLQGEVRAAGAQFTECQMSSDQWQYIANIGLVGPVHQDAGELISEQARKSGFSEVRVQKPSDGQAGSVTARKGEVQLRVLLATKGTPATVHNVEIWVDCTELDSDGQRFAEDDPGSDYAELK
ncbi:hypothetical protein ASG90_12930 [Nocardioides sp. Soil797]|nr:hypothetical protein ASG90_12930 [Nocardioides sp. Soil797]